MSDYLARLGARAMGAQPVRPAIAPIFQPAPLPLASGIDEESEREVELPPPPHEAPPDQAPPAERLVEIPAVPTARPNSDAGPPRRAPEPVADADPAPPPLRGAPEPAWSPRHMPPAEMAVPVRDRTPPSARGETPMDPGPVRQPDESETDVRAPAALVPVVSRPQPEPPPSVFAAPERSAMEADVRQLIARLADPREAAQARTTAQPPPPLVRINIGRIEVRAVTASPQPPDRKAPTVTAPAVSLATYLAKKPG